MTNIELLLDHFQDNMIPLICKSLSLELYVEESTITISSEKFVLDIIQINNEKTVMLSFIDESYKQYFNYVESYFNICLNQNNMKLFYYLLRYFTKSEKLTSKNQYCKITKENNFDICQCIFEENSFVLSFEDVVKKGINYNIFTHKHQHLLFIRNNVFCINLIQNEYFFHNTKILDIKNLFKEINENLIFYKLADENYKFGSDYIEKKIQDTIYVVLKNLSCFEIIGNIRKRCGNISFLLKKGFCLRKTIEFCK